MYKPSGFSYFGNKIPSFYRKMLIFILHFTFWLIIYYLWTNSSFLHSCFTSKSKENLTFLLLFSGFYLNVLLVYPQLFKKKHFSAYFISILTLLIGMTFLQYTYTITDELTLYTPLPLEYIPKIKFEFWKSIFIRNTIFISLGSLVYVFTDALSSYHLAQRNYELELSHFKTAKECFVAKEENDKLLFDIQKLQINEHFLLNLVDHIREAMLQKNMEVSGLISDLTDLLSYSVSNNTGERVPLSKEILFLEDYIRLKQTLYPKPILTFDKNISSADLEIAPMLFCVFIDNAFHYSRTLTEGFIHANLCVKKNRYLMFSCSSSIKNGKLLKKEILSSANLVEFAVRLSQIYPSHVFEIQVSDTECTLILHIDLDEFVGR